MKIKIELELEDAMELVTLHVAAMQNITQNIGDNPLLYSKLARVTNTFLNEVVDKTPDEMKIKILTR